MDLSRSYETFIPADIRAKYVFAEMRDAAGFLSAANPEPFKDLLTVLREFTLTLSDLTRAGGNKSLVAARLDEQFRELGWRETRLEIETTASLFVRPWRAAGETESEVRTTTTKAPGHLVDNVKDRVALDVEWNAKDGNLDRDLSNFRALHEAGMVNVGVMITRAHIRIKYAANYLAEAAGVWRFDKLHRAITLFGTTTTTNLEKLIPRLERGDAGGCPILAIAITDRCYAPGPDDPPLPERDDPAVLQRASTDDDDGELGGEGPERRVACGSPARDCQCPLSEWPTCRPAP